MPNTLSDGYALLAFLYAGIALGVVYDICRIIRLTARRRFLRTLSDGAFVLAFFLLFGGTLYAVTGLSLRLYSFAVAGLGAALQQFAFGRGICKRIVKRKRGVSLFSP